jgi:hypothetical protein
MISVAHFDREFSPAESELLFWLGFPGSTAFRGEPLTKQNIHYSWFGELQYPGIPVLTQLFPAPIPALEGYDATKHVVLHYPAKATRFPGEELDTLNPKGMSGSFLWDTKFVARTAAGKKWSVEDASNSFVKSAHISTGLLVDGHWATTWATGDGLKSKSSTFKASADRSIPRAVR